MSTKIKAKKTIKKTTVKAKKAKKQTVKTDSAYNYKLIPAVEAIVSSYRAGASLEDLASRYECTVSEIMAVIPAGTKQAQKPKELTSDEVRTLIGPGTVGTEVSKEHTDLSAKLATESLLSKSLERQEVTAVALSIDEDEDGSKLANVPPVLKTIKAGTTSKIVVMPNSSLSRFDISCWIVLLGVLFVAPAFSLNVALVLIGTSLIGIIALVLAKTLFKKETKTNCPVAAYNVAKEDSTCQCECECECDKHAKN